MKKLVEPAANRELRKIMKARHLTRKHVAELCGVKSVSTVDRWLVPFRVKTGPLDPVTAMPTTVRNPSFRKMSDQAMFMLKTKLGIVDRGEIIPRLKR
jgi:hypothetical protein